MPARSTFSAPTLDNPLIRNLLFACTSGLVLSACAAGDESDARHTPIAEAYLDCLRINGYSMLAAHRAGPADGVAENSLEAIRRSARLGAAMVELDVTRTADGVLVLMHDRTLDRTTTGSGPIGEARWSDLEALQLRDAHGEILEARIPTFVQAVETALEVGVIPQFDLKGVSPAELAAALNELDAVDHAALIAYTPEQAMEAQATAPDLMLSAPDRLDALGPQAFNFSTAYAWLGVGQADQDRDLALAVMEIESSAGLFPLETGDPDVYRAAAAAGVELLSVDDVATASAALGGPDSLRSQHETCRAEARP